MSPPRRVRASWALPLAGACLVLPGCGTLFKYVEGKPFPFRATATDAVCLWRCCVQPTPEPASPVQASFESPLAGIGWFLDLPFSIALDAVFLPIDIGLVLARDPTPGAPADGDAGESDGDGGRRSPPQTSLREQDSG